MNSLAMYETMNTISARMVEAARASDWDRLVALEKDCAGLSRELGTGDGPQPVAGAERERKIALIRQILANDAEVRRYTEPWMEQVRQFLGGGTRERNVRRVYGAHAGQ